MCCAAIGALRMPSTGSPDVTFGEDYSRIRAGYAAENMAVLRHFVRNLLEREQSQPGRSLKGKRLKAGWDHDYLLKILTNL
jgi:hypothetical protein